MEMYDKNDLHEEEINNLIEKIRECTSVNKNCDYLLEHSDCDMLIERIQDLEGRIKHAYDMLLYKPKELTGEKEKTMIDGNTMLVVNGKNFHCTCGANVFTQYSDDTFECHGCGNTFEGR